MHHPLLYWSFVALVVVVATFIVGVTQLAYARAQGRGRVHPRVALCAGLVIAAWMTLHWVLARSGVLLGPPTEMPPRALPYLAMTTAATVAVACSPVGRTIARNLSWPMLIRLQVFRIPIEMWLYQMWIHGHIPRQMTFVGWNVDVISGITAAALALYIGRRGYSARLVLAWNILGLALLAVVVGIAVTSAPTPMKMFEGPALTLVFEAPFNWIASVLVMTALAGHILVFRKMKHERAQAKP